MLWGKGDSSKLDDEAQRTLGHLRRMVETGHLRELSYGQTETLLRALDWYSDWEGTFRTLRHVRNVLVLMGFFLTAVWASGGNPIRALVGLIQ